MKIAHLCLACFYIEGMEYQENVLPRKHRQLGYDVEVITSQFCFDAKGNIFTREIGQYVNKDDVRVTIIPYSKKFRKYAQNYRIYDGLYQKLETIKPDIIFCHGGQFNSVGQLIKYLRDNPDVKFYLDSHADYGNAPVDTWKRKIIQRYFWGRQYRKLAPFCEKIWGTLPVRINYVKDIYRVDPDKVDLLVMGGDVERLDLQQRREIKDKVRERYGVKDPTFLIVTGGKIDKKKNIHLLMQAAAEIKEKDIRLLVFGEPNEEIKPYIDNLANSKNINMIGWLPPNECYALFYAADLAAFPGTHSVLWEQVCACGLPAIFRGTEGQDHVDMGGNCLFLYKDDTTEIKEKLLEIIENQELYNNMKKIAVERGYNTFSYTEIAKKAIGI